MKIVRSVDLRMVDMSDFLIVNLDMDIHTCGSYEEIFWANRLKNPILIHCEQGKARGCPDWLFPVLPHQHIFDKWTDICKYLWEVHTGLDTETYNRWMFFNYQDMMPKVDIDQTFGVNWETLEKELDEPCHT